MQIMGCAYRNMVNNYVSDWKKKLGPIINRHGRKTELAQWLSRNVGWSVSARQVQITKVFRLNITPTAEFVLCVEDWIKSRSFGEDGLRDRATVKAELEAKDRQLGK